MDNHNFTYLAFAPQIDIDETTLHLSYELPDGNYRHFDRLGFREEDKLQEYETSWATWLTNKDGVEIEGSRKVVKYRVAKSEVQMYQGFEMANTPAGVTYMDFYKRSSMNGLIEGLKDFGCTNVREGELLAFDKNQRNGVIAFDPFAFTPVQPVSFTEVVTHESAEDANDGSIVCTPVDGVSAFEMNVDDAGFVALADITGLAPGNHTVQLKGSDGGKSVVKNIYIEEFQA